MSGWRARLREALGLRAPGIQRPVTPAARRRLKLVLIAMASFSLTCGAIFGERGWFAVMRYKQERVRLQAEITSLEQQVRTLEEDIAALERDPRAMERLAREELALGLPGEVVIFLDAERVDPRREAGWIGPSTPPSGPGSRPKPGPATAGTQ